MSQIENPEEHLEMLRTIVKRLVSARASAGIVCGGLPIEIDDFVDFSGMLPAFMFKAGEIWTEITGEPNPILVAPDSNAVQGYRLENFTIQSAGVVSFLALDVCEAMPLTLDNRLDATQLFGIFSEIDKAPYIKSTAAATP